MYEYKAGKSLPALFVKRNYKFQVSPGNKSHQPDEESVEIIQQDCRETPGVIDESRHSMEASGEKMLVTGEEQEPAEKPLMDDGKTTGKKSKGPGMEQACLSMETFEKAVNLHKLGVQGDKEAVKEAYVLLKGTG